MVHNRQMISEKTGAKALIVLQSISGSDYYGPVHWRESIDNGDNRQTWSEPRPIPGFGRRPFTGDIEEAVSDVVPQYHAKTKRMIALGEIIYYRDADIFPNSRCFFLCSSAKCSSMESTRSGAALPKRLK